MEFCTFDTNVIIHKIVESDKKHHETATTFFKTLSTRKACEGILLSSVEKEFLGWLSRLTEDFFIISKEIIKASNSKQEIETCLAKIAEKKGDNIVQHFKKYFLDDLVKNKDVATITRFYIQFQSRFYEVKKQSRYKQIYVPEPQINMMLQEFPTFENDGKIERNDIKHLWSTIYLKTNEYQTCEVSLYSWDKHLNSIKDQIKNRYKVNIKKPEELKP